MFITKSFTLSVVIASGLSLIACSSSGLYRPLPEKLEGSAQVKGFPNIRAWGDCSNKAMHASAFKTTQQLAKSHHGKLPHEISALALSGGAADGAFAAGLLYGWTQSGSRPNFQLVTGISTGALIAPLAFLGPKYDGQLKSMYTDLSEDKLLKYNHPFEVLFSFVKPVLSPSIASVKPMKSLMKKILTQKMLNDIANEHLKGRRLFIGTTQMNAQRLVIWDIGEIAASHRPGSLALVHKILLSSAALPGLFPPQYFQVVANGRTYQEMHMDGGIETQVMLYEKALAPYAAVFSQHKNIIHKLYVIRNRKVSPEWEYVKPRLESIMIRSIFTLTKTQGVGDLYRLYYHAKTHGVDYNLAYIPASFTEHSHKIYDKAYMLKLFNLAKNMSKRGYPWAKTPP